MAGASYRIDLQDGNARRAIGLAVRRMDDPRPLYRHLGEGLLPRWKARFDTQTDPDGRRWQALSRAYQRRKHRNPDKVLTLRGHLRGTLRWQTGNNELLIGTNSKYGAIHQFGGTITIPARSQRVSFRTDSKGGLLSQAGIGNKFRNADKMRVFAKGSHKRKQTRWVTMSAYRINMPRRAFLGVSREDSLYIIAETRAFLSGAFGN